MVKKENKLLKILNQENNDFYIIGETAYNHEGDLKYLYKMVDEIAKLGINAVKFHLLLNLESYMTKDHPLFKRMPNWLFNEKEWQKIINYSIKKGLEVIALCDDVESIKFILQNKLKVAGIELHTTSLNDYFMMQELSKYSGVIILGIGGSTIDEIEYAINFFKKNNKKNLLLMYGFQNYPTNYRKINFKKMLRIKEEFKVPVGYADHTAFNDKHNELITVIPYLLGIKIFEKHYTPYPGRKRIDYQSSIDKKQFFEIIKYLKFFKQIFGSDSLKMSTAELKYGRIGPMKKAIVARKKITKGQKIKLSDLWYKRTRGKSDLKQNQIRKFIGAKTVKNIERDEVLGFNKIEK